MPFSASLWSPADRCLPSDVYHGCAVTVTVLWLCCDCAVTVPDADRCLPSDGMAGSPLQDEMKIEIMNPGFEGGDALPDRSGIVLTLFWTISHVFSAARYQPRARRVIFHTWFPCLPDADWCL